MKRILTILLALAVSLALRANHWTPNPYQFADNMNVISIIEINGVEQTNTNLELGAFCDGECRGSEMLAYYASLDRCLVFLTLYGQYGHQFTFRLYDHGTEREYDFDCANLITFVPNQILGELFDPYVFAFEGDAYSVNVDVIPEEGGTVTGSGIYMAGETCTLVATPNTGYCFEAWQEDGQVVGTEPNYQFVVESDKDLVAVFVRDEFLIEVTVAPENGGTAVGGGTYHAGAVCTLEAFANTGYFFVGWLEDGAVVGDEPTLSFTVEADRRLAAVFERIVCRINVTIEPEESGVVYGDGVYFYGETALLRASTAPDFYFIHWEEDGEVVSTDADYEFVVEGDRSLKAVFAMDAYLVEAETEPAEGGIIYGAGYYSSGMLCTLRAVARPGYAFVEWVEGWDVVSEEPTFSFVVEGDHHFVAYFERIVYHITLTADPVAGGSVIGGGNFHYGETCEVEALPAYNYIFDRWKESGGTVSSEATYSFMVIRDRDLVATFDYYDGVEKHSSCTAYVEDHHVVVTDAQGQTMIPEMVVDVLGRRVRNSDLRPGVYVALAEGMTVKVVVR